jgi:hypothetical protein
MSLLKSSRVGIIKELTIATRPCLISASSINLGEIFVVEDTNGRFSAVVVEISRVERKTEDILIISFIKLVLNRLKININKIFSSLKK